MITVVSAGGTTTVVLESGAGIAASGAGVITVSSFLLQAVMETANKAARRTEYFIYLPFTNNIKTHTRKSVRDFGNPTDARNSNKMATENPAHTPFA